MTLDLPDLVPQELRRRWKADGIYPGRSLFDLFSAQTREHPERPAVVEPDATVSYARLRHAALALAGELLDRGVRPGDVVAVNLANGWRPLAADLAVAAIGAVCLPYPLGRRRQDTLALLRRSRAVAALITRTVGDQDYARTVDGLRGLLPELRHIYVDGPPLPGTQALEPVWHRPPRRPDRPVPPDPDAAARIVVSSGTEAAPKLVAYSHNALAAGRGRLLRNLSGDDEPFRLLCMVPLATAFGSLGLATLCVRGGTVLVTPRFDPSSALRMVAEHRPSHVTGVPTMYQRILTDPALPRTDVSSLRCTVSGGAPLPPATAARMRRALCPTVATVYGSADGANSHTRPDDPVAVVDTTAGRPDPAITSLRIVDEQGEELPTGRTGEIWARGPVTPLCYVNDPELNRRYRAPGGWVRTGDLGAMRPDGRLRLTGRTKDVVIRAGLNISPAEVELLVCSHPAVAGAACRGVLDDELGERLAVFVVPVPSERPPTLPELRHFLLEERGLERFKLPEALHLLDRFPTGPAGKIDRARLDALARASNESAEPPVCTPSSRPSTPPPTAPRPG
ncbi:class I adenylate-forming enzyme family protein [Streptomyces sp. NPDC102282]|uniref:class I adenylate-forming enzyme family protein n=1 Tax=Streptomyces sp. NPDC102282 TaxID=3366154 RepID=UPI0038245D45